MAFNLLITSSGGTWYSDLIYQIKKRSIYHPIKIHTTDIKKNVKSKYLVDSFNQVPQPKNTNYIINKNTLLEGYIGDFAIDLSDFAVDHGTWSYENTDLIIAPINDYSGNVNINYKCQQLKLNYNCQNLISIYHKDCTYDYLSNKVNHKFINLKEYSYHKEQIINHHHIKCGSYSIRSNQCNISSQTDTLSSNEHHERSHNYIILGKLHIRC